MKKIEKIMIGVLIFIALIGIGSLIYCMYRNIEYNRKHPCIETRTQTVCNTYDVCDYGVMLPGFCITREETSCYEEIYCVKRK